MVLPLVALLNLWPMLTDGRLEATAEPRLGLHAQVTLNRTTFGASAGTDYQSLRVSLSEPNFNADVEHRWQDGHEAIYYRLHVPAAVHHPVYLTQEFRLVKVVSRVVDGAYTDEAKHGRLRTYQAREQRMYVTWYGRKVLARIGLGPQNEVGLTLSTRF